MDVKVLVATHKKYEMPKDDVYIPIHVGKEGKQDIGYIGDNTGENISYKNSYFCELTGLYWGIKNLECDYIGLVHYRRHFADDNIAFKMAKDKFNHILTKEKMENILAKYDAILPKKRKYYIETLYSHYSHTHYSIHLDETRDIIKKYYPDYLDVYDKVMNSRSAHMFNMFIMKRELADEYCEWLFFILNELEKRIDATQYDAFQARLFGRVSERLLNVWIEKNNIKYKEVPHMHMEKINWAKKGSSFLKAKFRGNKYNKSF
ncbi:DUF4422 domain-containing protein [Clostridium perfringens]|uniref:DUF4422 domain-containing protein n=1 Tax=Clostridium perfringens TaxID=1502 RepID=UPI00189789D6|nr:DUF4422 domain-containing protein [Clostridium perfringens]EHR1327904.1 DUF4422 domain-containing protein [Clostridium perfringens]EHR1331037.1 DUF4422 domain-containing protein [Clostridium perfringens]EHR1424514.1 DUF4422 domain-containing protein [Clostridium perfringens]EJT6142683.1 DUF4422 domain-containing protein [Clostridium perfringens]ELC8434909.1 DUF4422 domain-containing protein [Clostridium perfringens]